MIEELSACRGDLALVLATTLAFVSCAESPYEKSCHVRFPHLDGNQAVTIWRAVNHYSDADTVEINRILEIIGKDGSRLTAQSIRTLGFPPLQPGAGEIIILALDSASQVASPIDSIPLEVLESGTWGPDEFAAVTDEFGAAADRDCRITDIIDAAGEAGWRGISMKWWAFSFVSSLADSSCCTLKVLPSGQEYEGYPREFLCMLGDCRSSACKRCYDSMFVANDLPPIYRTR